MRVIAVVFETGVSGDLLAQVVHAIEDVCKHVALLDVRLGSQPEGPLPLSAVV